MKNATPFPSNRLVPTAGFPTTRSIISSARGNAKLPFRLACGFFRAAILATLCGWLALSAYAQSALTNGGNHSGTITLPSEEDTWTFDAAQGDALRVKIGEVFQGETDPGFFVELEVKGPDGALVGSHADYEFAEVAKTAPLSGTYTVVVANRNAQASGPGNYLLHFAKTPGDFVVPGGDEGGALVNGGNHAGRLHHGDLDMWRFEAAQGDALRVKVGEVFEGETDPEFFVYLEIRGPDGGLVGSHADYVSAEVAKTAPLSGTYTVLVANSNGRALQPGSYLLHFARTPGEFIVPDQDEGGALVNGGNHAGRLHHGDLDMWSFEAIKGDALRVKVGEVFEGETDPDFFVYVEIMGPDGALVGSSADYHSAEVAKTAPLSGTYTVLVANSNGRALEPGNYLLHFARTPGEFIVPDQDEGGALVNGGNHAGRLHLGDLDMWSFEAIKGDALRVKVGEVFEGETDPDFFVEVEIRGPDGALVGSSADYVSAEVAKTAPLSGTYTVIVANSDGRALLPGSYLLHFARTPGDFIVPDQDEGGALVNGGNHAGRLHLGDLDVWRFEATKGDAFWVTVDEVFEGETDPEFYVWMQVIGPDGASVGSASGYESADVAKTAPLSGTYTVLVANSNGRALERGVYQLWFARIAPDLIVPETVHIPEGTLLQAVISAVDPLTPEKTLAFELLSGPPGATLAANNATNATVSWATTEAIGPSTNVFIARVTDVVEGTTYRRTNSFSVVVNEINTAPQLNVPVMQTTDELASLSVSVSAADSDIPENTLAFSLASAPQGMVIDPASGTIAWTPTEAQGPSTHTIAVVVTDNNPAAVNAHQLSTTNTFVVVVREANLPPILAQPADATVDELTPLNINLQASDPDVPDNPLAFSLSSGPPGMVVNPATGVITWTPGEAQGPGTNEVIIKVDDGGDPLMSATSRFTVVVREVNSAPVFAAIPDQETPDDSIFRVRLQASDPDQPAEALTFALGSGAPAGVTVDPQSGELTWPIGRKLARETHDISVTVTDEGTPPLMAQATVRVVIIPVALRLMPIADRELAEQALLTLTAAVTNSPESVAPYTYALEGEAPEGASINPTTGVLFWRPSEAQGPSSNSLVIRVSDSATPANVATQGFSVVVREVNQAPVLEAVPQQSVAAGGLLMLTVRASDADEPKNQLTFSLGPDAPEGMSIGASTGLLQWTPATTHDRATNRVTLEITDSGNPPLQTTGVLTVIVSAQAQVRLEATLLSATELRLRLYGGVGRTYLVESSADLANWSMVTNFVSTADVTEFVQPVAPGPGMRFFRAVSP